MAKKINTTGRKSAVAAATKTVIRPRLLPKAVPAAEGEAPKPSPARAAAPVPATKKAGGAQKNLPPMTTVVARVDVGWGNCVFVRGEGGGLSWEKGVPLLCQDGGEWVWVSTAGDPVFTFKFLVNDIFWEDGENHSVKRGGRHEFSPQF
ncbi:MAG: hypothetical protein LBD14_04825 [Puniceicoccales bacterium]|nr:hypothetical protein [Puniceicoccales bacterium]